MDIEHKSFPASDVKVLDGDAGELEAVVAVFNNVDAGNDRIIPGFFSKSIERKLPKGVWGHDWVTPVAKTLEARELLPGNPALPETLRDLGGLYIKARFNLETQRGREAYSDIKFGIIDEFSIGYKATRTKTEEKSGVRELIEGELYEWSPVLVGMNDRTALMSIKSGSHKSVSGGRSEAVPARDFAAHSQEVVSAVGSFVSRAGGRVEARLKDGRELSGSNRTALQRLHSGLLEHCSTLKDLLDRTAPKSADPPEAAREVEGIEGIAVAKSGNVVGGAIPESGSPAAVPAHDWAAIRSQYISTLAKLSGVDPG
jgi:HK97 family phage prohead protease